MNKIKNIRGLLMIIFSFLYLTFSVILTIPGMGLESIMFINSVKNQLKIIMPKNRYVLDPTSPLYKPIMNNVIRSSYLADAKSTINYRDAQEVEKFEKEYTNFTYKWFDNRWADVIENKQEIDFYDVAMDMIEFDQAIAKEYQSYGYVNTGTQWIFNKNGINEIFSKDLEKNALKQQSIWDQEVYESMMEWTGPGLTGMKVKKSPGTNLVNNKVWFLNTQIDSIRYALNIQWLQNPFINKNLSANDLPEYVTIDDLYHPNFTRGIILARMSFIVLLSSAIITPVSLTYGLLEVKRKKASKQKGE